MTETRDDHARGELVFAFVAVLAIVATILNGACLPAARIGDRKVQREAADATSDTHGLGLRCSIRQSEYACSVKLDIVFLNKRESTVWIDPISLLMGRMEVEKRLLLARNGELVTDFAVMCPLVNEGSSPIPIAPGREWISSFELRDLKPGHYTVVGLCSYTVGLEGENHMRPVALAFPPESFDIKMPGVRSD